MLHLDENRIADCLALIEDVETYSLRKFMTILGSGLVKIARVTTISDQLRCCSMDKSNLQTESRADYAKKKC